MTSHDAAKNTLMMDVLLFRLAIVAWLVCVIAPIDGTWFAGVGLWVVSVMGSVVMLATLFAGAASLVRMESAALRLLPACVFLCLRVFCYPF